MVQLRERLEQDLVTMTTKQTNPNNNKESMEVWLQYERLTTGLAQQLCEQLRLVLEPTLASKMRYAL